MPSCFNPRPSFLAGETPETAHGTPRSSPFQSTPVISGGRNLSGIRVSVLLVVSIHARHFWRAKQFTGGPPLARPVVSIHARHFWRAKRAGQRDSVSGQSFQSTPVISGGRNATRLTAVAGSRCFNPRPSFLAGETVDYAHLFERHLFQSTPVISGGRNREPAGTRAPLRRFNPRPSFLAGETATPPGREYPRNVSIHARHFWRAKPQVALNRLDLDVVSIHARHFWRAKQKVMKV